MRDRSELSVLLDNLIEFSRTDQLLKTFRGDPRLLESAISSRTPGGFPKHGVNQTQIAQLLASRIGKSKLAAQLALRKKFPSLLISEENERRRLLNKLSSKLDDIITFADPRPRNPLGEFTNQEGGPDANAMATVYKMPQQQPPQNSGPGLPKLAGAALVGGALGQVGGNIGKSGWGHMAKLVKRLSKQAKK